MRLFRHFQVLRPRSAQGKRSIFLLMVKVSRQIIQGVPRSNTLLNFFYQRVLARRKLFLPLNLSVADVLIRMKDRKLSEALRKHRGLSVSTLSSSVETTKINKNGWCVFTFWQILPHRLASEPESAVNLDFIALLNENKHHNTRQIRTNEVEATDRHNQTFFLFFYLTLQAAKRVPSVFCRLLSTIMPSISVISKWSEMKRHMCSPVELLLPNSASN